MIFAPAAENKTLTRAAADNTADVTVQVQEGLFWAVDKIKVKNPKGLASNLDMYNEGQAVIVGGLEITKEKYGEAQEITTNGAIAGGVYFVSANDLTLTYNQGTSVVENLIIIPNSDEVTSINLNIDKSIYLGNALICKNTNIKYTATATYPVRVQSKEASIIIDRCTISGLLFGSGFAMPEVKDEASIGYFGMTDTNIKVENTGTNLYLVTNMNCNELRFENNIVYYSGVPEATSNVENFKVFQGPSYSVNKLTLTSNTFIDIESGYSNGKTSAIVYPSKIGDITVNKNIYYFTYREYPAFLIRVASAAESKVTIAENNYAYLFETGLNLNVFQNKIGDTSVGFTSNDVDLYDTTDPATFNKSTGTFIPKEGYTQYGAQR